MYKLVPGSECNRSHPVMVASPDETFDSLRGLLEYIYGLSDETLDTAKFLYGMKEYRVGHKLSSHGYYIDYPFAAYEMFDFPVFEHVRGHPWVHFFTISLEEGGIVIVYIDHGGCFNLCFQTEEDWKEDQKLMAESSFNPYWVMREIDKLGVCS